MEHEKLAPRRQYFAAYMAHKLAPFIQNCKPIIDYAQIPDICPYLPHVNGPPITAHLGQRKLLLNNIEFLTYYGPDQHMSDGVLGFVIYAGSAPGIHFPLIERMFPMYKYIFIDPNFHTMNTKLEYIYQNPDNCMQAVVGKPPSNLTRAQFFALPNTFHNVTDPTNAEHKVAMFKIINNFYKKMDAATFINAIRSSKSNCFIIQDYMSTQLSERLAELMRGHEIVFNSDVRTNIFGEMGPSDVDLLWNNTQQILWCSQLVPRWSMLKFHPPYFHASSETKQFLAYCENPANPSEMANIFSVVKADLDAAFRLYGFDYVRHIKERIRYGKRFNRIRLIDDALHSGVAPQDFDAIIATDRIKYREPQYFYARHTHIFIQPWQPPRSTEARLVLTGREVANNFVTYLPNEWEEKFKFYLYARSKCYVPHYYNVLRKAHGGTEIGKVARIYDASLDCAREIHILANYLRHIDDTISDKLNLVFDIDGVRNLLANPQFVRRMLDIKHTIDKETNWDIMGNAKATFCGYLRNVPNETRFIFHTPESSTSIRLTVMGFDIKGNTPKPLWVKEIFIDYTKMNELDNFIDALAVSSNNAIDKAAIKGIVYRKFNEGAVAKKSQAAVEAARLKATEVIAAQVNASKAQP